MCGEAMAMWASAKKYGKRKGLRGPYHYSNGRVLYFDPVENMHWDPTTDFFVDDDEVAGLTEVLFSILSK